MRFQIYINGKQKCMSGLNGLGVLTACLTRVKRNPNKIDENKLENTTLEEFCKEKVKLEVGSLDCNRENLEHGLHFNFLNQEVKIGDEITIKILDPGDFDEPLNKDQKPT